MPHRQNTSNEMNENGLFEHVFCHCMSPVINSMESRILAEKKSLFDIVRTLRLRLFYIRSLFRWYTPFSKRFLLRSWKLNKSCRLAFSLSLGDKVSHSRISGSLRLLSHGVYGPLTLSLLRQHRIEFSYSTGGNTFRVE